MNLDKAKIIVASGPVIVEDNKVLLNRHGDNKKQQKYWKFPGGRIKNFDFTNEMNSLEETCKREVKEEMGVDIEILSAIKPMMIKTADRENTIAILIHYLAKRIGEIAPGKDIVEWKWFDINNLAKNCAINIKPVIEEYKKRLDK